ncbi:MAG TPA: S8 family peptidase [Solirubrobacteraceae bacterium]|nr:S8 family peptidase [Solirubrobacteraceae bacterium]
MATLSLGTRAPAQDSRQGEQWAVAPGTVFDLPGAWALTRGAGVVVAVIDSGTRLDHPDLAKNIWTNFGEVPGNGKDDDGNGYVDDVHGVDLTTQRKTQNLTDGAGHGTHVAGIIAAARNGRGVVGVAPEARIMTVKVLDADGAGNMGAVADGIGYAAANGARIINLSLGGPFRDKWLAAAVKKANAADVLIIASAGNEGISIDRKPFYPASFPSPNVIGVAATAPNSGRQMPDFSNYGKLTVPIAAPGEEVLSTSKTGGYEYKSGTSMAAPHATGVAALMAAVRPDASAAELRAMMLQAATRASLPVGAGYLDAARSVVQAMNGSSYDGAQRPAVRVLLATRNKRGIVAQIAGIGNVQAIRRYRVTLGGRVVGVKRRGSPFTVRIRSRRGGTLKVEGLDRRGGVLASATRRVVAVRKRKGNVKRGRHVGSSVRIG